MNKQTGILIATFATVLIVSALLSYLLFGRTATPAPNTAQPPPAAQSTQSPQAAAPSGPAEDGSLLSYIFKSPDAEPERANNLGLTVARITLRLALAALLVAVLAFRPRRHRAALRLNPYVAQTQILLAVVASALMMIVGDSAARAFGIFAAASLVRFRTNIRDPKEITVLLVSLAVGLATGVGHLEVGVILSLFVLVTLWVLEYYEPVQASRTMELTVLTRDIERTQAVLKTIFKEHQFSSELRTLNRVDDQPLGKIVYQVCLSLIANTDQLSEEIIAADPEFVDGIEWAEKKSGMYIYG
jgi:uncharacterized membrane protein YhiD involved in acid resistance